jgi:hypothetical protein
MKPGFLKVIVTLYIFHKCANDGQIIEGDENLLKHASEYYANLFAPPPIDYDIQLDSDLWDGIPKMLQADNRLLCKPFSEEEIKIALRQMEKNKATGLDKIPIEFYQHCWAIVKKDIVQLFYNFFHRRVDISKINYGIITLLPKIIDA